MDQNTKLPPDGGRTPEADAPASAGAVNSAPESAAGGVSLPAPPPFDKEDPSVWVTQYFHYHRVNIRYDGSIVKGDLKSNAAAEENIDKILARDEATMADLLDEMVLFAKVGNYSFGRSIIETACRQTVRSAKGARRQAVLGPLIKRKLTDAEKTTARAQWANVGALFDMDEGLSVAILQHFIWQVKRKALGLSVDNHLMPIIWSAVQGTGKTTFIWDFVGPLDDLASPAFLSDIADPRSGQIHSFPAVIVDEMQDLEKKALANLKGVMTATTTGRRVLGTSSIRNYVMHSTYIGTSNKPIQDLVRDETGSRRFAMLPFRNGCVEKGGDERVWEIVKSLDYELLWRSVLESKSAPIKSVLAQLNRHQGLFVPESPVLSWLKKLDINSEEIGGITYKFGVKAGPLHELYMRQTKHDISPQKFSQELLSNCDDLDVPFAGRKADKKCSIYVFKRRTVDLD